MIFSIVKNALVELFAKNEFDRFKTVGHQRQGKSAKSVKGLNRLVQIFYSSGQFPKSSGRVKSTKRHDVTFRVELTASEPATGDLSAIKNDGSTADQIKAALSEIADASFLADESMDDLFSVIYGILNDPRNYDLSLGKGVVSNIRIESFKKNEPIPRGELVILTANVVVTCNVAENVNGEEGILGIEGVTVDLDIDGDDVQKTGVTTI